MTLSKQHVGLLSIPGNVTPISLELPDSLSYEGWKAVGDTLRYVAGAVQWWLGDWILFGERKYGEMYSQALEATEYEYQTLRDATWVADQFEMSRRRDNVSWSHHREVASLEPAEQDEWLDRTQDEGWTHKELRTEVQKAKRRAAPTPSLPTGTFDVIYADPPWQYDNAIESWGPASLHYPAMSTEAIEGLDIPVADNAVLFLWATNPFLEDALRVVESWGFEYKTNVVWVKTDLKRPGSGFYVRGHHELLFICTRGSYVPDQTGKSPISSVLYASVREHSRKPEEVYGLIESLYPDGRYLELFARHHDRNHWAVWGAEVPGDLALVEHS
jgi:N6-adenosine-specific RNA methylase IME4